MNQNIPRAQTIRMKALELSILAAPQIYKDTAEKRTQADIISRANDFEVFINSAKDDA